MENNESTQDKKVEKKLRCRTMVVEGTRYRTLYTKKFKNREKWSEPDDNKIVSVMPGKVLTVLVRKGQKIEKGDTLLVLESMKMQNNITSPLDGTIKAIKVAAGQNIPKGYIMIQLEEE